MIRKAVCVLILALLPVATQAQRPEGEGSGGPNHARRAELEAQIFSRFMDRVTEQLKLDTGSRQRLEEQLRANGDRRRALARSTVQLRQQLVRATRDSTASEAEIQRLLNQFDQLRQQENELWSSEQQALANLLSPRQRALFTLEWLRFNERVRGMMMERRPQGHR